MSREELLGALRALLKDREETAEQGRETARLLHDVEVHRVELELQNRDLREAQGALERSRDRFQELYDFAPVAYFTFNRAGYVQEVNLTGATMVGRDRAKVLGHAFLDLVQVRAPAAFWEHLDRCAERRKAVVTEMRIGLPRLGLRDVQVATVPVLEGDTAVAFRTSFTDVTLRRHAEAELERARVREEGLRKGFEALDRAAVALSRILAQPDGADRAELLRTIADHARVIGDCEYAVFAIAGEPDAPFSTWVPSGMGPHVEGYLGCPPRPRGVLGEVIRAEGSVRLRDLRTHPSFEGFPTGHPVMKSLLGVPVRLGDVVLGHLFLANRRWEAEFSREDQRFVELYAERAAIALEIARLGEEVRSAVRTRDDVLAVVSHDLRNPLAAIRLSAAQLARKLQNDDPDRSQRKVDVILRAAERMVRLISDLLDAATIERGTFTIEPRPERVAPILDECLQAHEPLAAARSLRLRRDLAPGLPPIRCDRQRVLQVLGNLVGNAIKFVQDGGLVEVRARAEGDAVRFAVADDGPGIPEEQAARLFERFWKGDRGEREGVGLGLFIARGIVEAHGGTLELESTPGAGSTFQFTIPTARAAPDEPAPPP